MACDCETVNRIVKILDNKKAKDIVVLDVRGLTTLTDYFVLATGGSARQVQALSDHVEEELGKAEQFPVNKEGYHTGDWVLIGYDEAIVHIFQKETRDFYQLERIWKDAPAVEIAETDSEQEG